MYACGCSPVIPCVSEMWRLFSLYVNHVGTLQAATCLLLLFEDQADEHAGYPCRYRAGALWFGSRCDPFAAAGFAFLSLCT